MKYIVVKYFKVLFFRLFGGTKENHENSYLSIKTHYITCRFYIVQGIWNATNKIKTVNCLWHMPKITILSRKGIKDKTLIYRVKLCLRRFPLGAFLLRLQHQWSLLVLTERKLLLALWIFSQQQRCHRPGRHPGGGYSLWFAQERSEYHTWLILRLSS